MKKFIADLRAKQERGSFEREVIVRISVVARICQVLGRDGWNPREFYPSPDS